MPVPPNKRREETTRLQKREIALTGKQREIFLISDRNSPARGERNSCASKKRERGRRVRPRQARAPPRVLSGVVVYFHDNFITPSP